MEKVTDKDIKIITQRLLTWMTHEGLEEFLSKKNTHLGAVPNLKNPQHYVWIWTTLDQAFRLIE